MNRRDFLKGTFGLGVAAFISEGLFKLLEDKPKSYILKPANFPIAKPVRQDITILPAEDSKKLRLGWVVYEEVVVQSLTTTLLQN